MKFSVILLYCDYTSQYRSWNSVCNFWCTLFCILIFEHCGVNQEKKYTKLTDKNLLVLDQYHFSSHELNTKATLWQWYDKLEYGNLQLPRLCHHFTCFATKTSVRLHITSLMTVLAMFLSNVHITFHTDSEWKILMRAGDIHLPVLIWNMKW
jgi:hypothetical protein